VTFNTSGDDPECHDNDVMENNTARLNGLLAALGSGDTLVVASGIHCMAGGVRVDRPSHIVVDIRGDLLFGQNTSSWPMDPAATATYTRAIMFNGATNVTVTSSTTTGRIRAKSCVAWYPKRVFGIVPGGNTLLYFGPDVELTFASSRVLIERITVEDGPNYQIDLAKIHDVTVRHVVVLVNCIPQISTVTELVGAYAVYTDGIDIWGSLVHVWNVSITNADDCICVKGHVDGSGIMSVDWLVENSTARGEGLSVGSIMSGHFTVHNITFRNIEMDATRKGIYIKADGPGNTVDVIYRNLTIRGPTLQFPVMIGAVHQFLHNNCPVEWPYLRPGTCSVQGNSTISVTIDGLVLARPNGLPLGRTADFVIIGNARTKTSVAISGVTVRGPPAFKLCEDPPLDSTAVCTNACFAADVQVTDGSYPLTCVNSIATVARGECVPLIGSISQRCASGNGTKDEMCRSGLRCS